MLPVFVLIVFAAIEASNAIFLQQTLTLAAYEAASELSTEDGKLSVAESRCLEILKARKVSSYSLKTNRDKPSELKPGEVVIVEVSAPASAYSVGPSWFFRSKTIRAYVFMAQSS